MARGRHRKLSFAVLSPGVPEGCERPAVPRLSAPRSLLTTPNNYAGDATIHLLPDSEDKNSRPWHAKMLKLVADGYVGLMVGSSNFTCAGLGIGPYRNAEANLVTVVTRVPNGREVSALEAVWPPMERVSDPEAAEWLAPKQEPDEDEQSTSPPLPEGFLSALFRAGSDAAIVFRLDPERLPNEWQIHTSESAESEILSAASWSEAGSPKVVERSWQATSLPTKLIVLWGDCKAFLPINIEDHTKLPAPTHLEGMSADDMLGILASSDPSAAFRAWAKRTLPSSIFDDDLDSATPAELDPLRRYDLQATFLHRIRNRSRILAQMRSNIERPVWGQKALEWRLRGLIGAEPLADRFLQEFENTSENADEALLTLADVLLVLREVNYKASDGCMPVSEFNQVFHLFLKELVERHSQSVSARKGVVSEGAMKFWLQVVTRCQK